MTALRTALERILASERILDRPIDRVAFASDASFYRLIPQAVVRPRSVPEIQGLFRLARNRGIPLCFRAAGTSLSGQAVTDGILVDLAQHWRGLAIEAGGTRVRVQPGVIGAVVNARLRPFGTRMGPDPASIATCMLGGILANNSSGMCCGVAQNAYHTVESLTMVLPDGSVVDSAAADADARFAAQSPQVVAGLLRLRDRVRADARLVARIRAKYLTKNTTGYGLNAFLDEATPARLLARLLIGSEGTLGFIAEAVLRTVPDLPAKSTALLLFASVHAAATAVPPLAASGAAALEIMDRAALRAVERQRGAPAALPGLPPGAAALLVEFHGRDDDHLVAVMGALPAALAGLDLLYAPTFTSDSAEQAALWAIRKGMFPSVGAVRARGTSVILEDIAVPVACLATCIADLQELFVRHGYDDAIIFGHAKDGNLHFVLSQAFAGAAEIARYRTFIEDVVALVVGRYDGALKAEHGTGRNMAPFVATEWGPDAYAVMRQLKHLLDPAGVLNPGVIINADPLAHVRDLKSLPLVASEVDACIECGYCEPRCPSRDLTTTPRQRIAVQRELSRLHAANDRDGHAALAADWGYAGLDTCATDGMCATACPVSIDTGALVKRLRGEGHNAVARLVAGAVARNLPSAEAVARTGMRLGHAVGGTVMRAAGAMVAGLTDLRLPRWSTSMPPAARPLPAGEPTATALAVYVPTCLTATLASGDGSGPQLADQVVALARRAGVPVHVPIDAAGWCCGMAFASKGYAVAAAQSCTQAVDRLWRWSREGTLPVVIDTASCTYTLRHDAPGLDDAHRERLARLRVIDLIEFVHDHLLPHLRLRPLPGAVVLHPTCSAVKLDLTAKLRAIAARCCAEAHIPASWGCCGFAGDRGLLLPELTAAATAAEAAEVRSRDWAGHYSCSRTCELGMEEATGRPYRSFIDLVMTASAP